MPFTEQGYKRKTYDEWLKDDIELAKKLFGDDIDTSETTPLGKYIRLGCEDKRDLSEDIEQIFLSFNYKTATGSALRRLCANIGVSVSAGEAATHTVTIRGTKGYVIPAGTEVSTDDKSALFHTVNDATISENGTVSVLVECNARGIAGNVKAGEINTLVYTDANIEGVTDSILVKLGEDEESDASVRAKYEKAQKGRGSGTYSAVLGGVYQIAGVRTAYLEYNKTMQDRSDLPAKSFRVSVLADESLKEKIAQTIFEKMPLCSLDVGDEVVKVTDRWGRDHEVHFSWTKERMIYVYVKILVDSTWTSASQEEAISAIVEHINASTNGKKVYLKDIYTSLKGITGKVNILDLRIGETEGDYQENDIEIGATEVARSDASCVTVEVKAL